MATIDLVELTIQESKDERSRIFNKFYLKKLEIEKVFGKNINLDGPLEGRNRCTIKSLKYEGGYLNEDKYDPIFENLLSKMNALTRALRPYLK